MNRLIPRLVTTALVASLFPSWTSVRAADLTWTNTSGGNWNVAANWSPNQVPAAGDNLFITNSGTYAVTVNANATVNTLLLGGESGTQTLANSGATLTLTNSASVGPNGVFAMSGGTLAGDGGLVEHGELLVRQQSVTG